MAMTAIVVLLSWLYLFLAHGRFWLSRPELPPARPAECPDVDIIVPARDEAATIGAVIASLLAQDYGGRFRVTLVDDNSTDGTALGLPRAANLEVIRLQSKPAQWSGQLWRPATHPSYYSPTQTSCMTQDTWPRSSPSLWIRAWDW